MEMLVIDRLERPSPNQRKIVRQIALRLDRTRLRLFLQGRIGGR